MRRASLPLMILVLVLTALPTFAGLSKKTLDHAREEFNTAPRTVRSDVDLMPLNYVEHDGASYSYHLPRRFVRLSGDGDRFTIRDVDYGETYVKIELESERGAKVSIHVLDDREYEQEFLDVIVPTVLAEVFDFREAGGAPRFVANTESRMLHLRGCNHLPPPARRLPFARLDEAESKGFRRCPVCFAAEQILPIEGYGPQRAQALEAARLKELAFPPVEDPAVQARVAEAGEAVLAAFPIELTGYDYVFKVLHSEIPNAFSLPTGFIYVTDELMAAIEDPLELYFILAHEIAHAELRRPSVDMSPPSGLVDLERYYADLFRRIQFQETEADLLGLMTVAALYDGEDILERTRGGLSKMQFVYEEPTGYDDPYATHPGFTERLSFFDPDHFGMCRIPPRFEGLNRDGEVIATARLVAVHQSRKREYRGGGEIGGPGTLENIYFYYLLIEATDLLNEPIFAADGKLRDVEGVGVGLKSGRLHFPVLPNGVGLVALEGDLKGLSLCGLEQLELDINTQIREWRRTQ